MLWGKSGTGKSSQLLTLLPPGKKAFVYIFDPSGLEAFRGFEEQIDYEEFLPDQLNLNIASSTSQSKDATAYDRASTLPTMEPKAALNFLAHLRKSAAEGFFEQYEVIALDSITYYAKLVMDRVVWANSRQMATPHQDDYAPEMNSVFNGLREFTSLPYQLFATTHEEDRENRRTGVISTEYALTGKLRIWVTGLFSDVYHTAIGDNGEYILQCKQTQGMGGIRSSFRWTPAMVNATIENWDEPWTQGLGKILAIDEKKRATQ